MKIRLLNVKYSPNLGDGLLVECLENRCRAHLPASDVQSVDLAGRTAFANAPSSSRDLSLRILKGVPAGPRQLLVGSVLQVSVMRRLSAYYERQLRGARAVIVGGGHLLSDLDLNFPLKLYAALRVAAREQTPVWIHGCGVSERWSRLGAALFQSAFRGVRLIDVAVRDETSARAWNTRLGHVTGRAARVVRDPGLLTSRVYGTALGQGACTGSVGLGVIGPAAIGYHGAPPVSERQLLAWFTELARVLWRKGRSLALVSNGSPEDRRFGELLARTLNAIPEHPAPVALPVHRRPSELAATIAQLDCLVGFRMHGLIAAASFGVPTYALAWDPKVRAFMESIGRGQHYFDVGTTSPTHVAEVLESAAARREEGLDRAMTECERDIGLLCRSIVDHCGMRTRPGVSTVR